MAAVLSEVKPAGRYLLTAAECGGLAGPGFFQAGLGAADGCKGKG